MDRKVAEDKFEDGIAGGHNVAIMKFDNDESEMY